MGGEKKYIFIIFILVIMLIVVMIKQHKLKKKIKTVEMNLLHQEELRDINHYREMANKIYDNVLEADITNNTLIGENSLLLLEQLGLSLDATYEECIKEIEKQFVMPEFVKIHKDGFSRKNILDKHKNDEKMFTLEFIERADLVNYHWTQAIVCIYKSKVNNAVNIISFVKNIQKEKEKELNLKELAYTDSLTGLMARKAFIEYTEKVLQDENKKHPIAALMVDLDYFKNVNDTLGHDYGDEVLKGVADILKNLCDGWKISRLGGDEFMMVIENFKNINFLKSKAAQICEALKLNHVHDNCSVFTSASVGIAVFSQKPEIFKIFYNQADAALYKAKANGKQGYYLVEC